MEHQSAEGNIVNIKRATKILAMCTAFALVVLSYLLGERIATNSVVDVGTRQLQILSLDLESILERYESLPYSLSVQPITAQTLQETLPSAKAAKIEKLNHILSDVQQQAKVAAIYLMDNHGKTIASSNWQAAQSYINKNFGFRPYFIDAMQGRTGRFYAIGSTTAEPGYFIAQPVYAQMNASEQSDASTTDVSNNHQIRSASTEPLGVIAVKISLNDFSATWHGIVEPVALVDKWGVVFLSNRPEWQYRSLGKLSGEAQAEIQRSLQYVGKVILPLSNSLSNGFSPSTKTSKAELEDAVGHAVGRLGWRLLMLPNQNVIRRSAVLWALGMALVIACLLLWWRIVKQRNWQLEERGLARAALQKAAEELERKIDQRTEELTEANQAFAHKYTKLKETEQLLRVTQSELVQAGKLTMLGQMAAGVTHELNQPLTAIRAFSDNAITFIERGELPRARENLTLISSATARMASIIAQLKGFKDNADKLLSDVNLAQSIKTAAKLLENEFEQQGCLLTMNLAEEIVIKGDAIRIEQVLINLLKNALDASENAHEKLVIVALEKIDHNAVITIEDRGEGLSDIVAEKLFEPFFTTKESGKGLGLGLAISSSIIQAMNGSLFAKNAATEGAVFVLNLPLD